MISIVKLKTRDKLLQVVAKVDGGQALPKERTDM